MVRVRPEFYQHRHFIWSVFTSSRLAFKFWRRNFCSRDIPNELELPTGRPSGTRNLLFGVDFSVIDGQGVRILSYIEIHRKIWYEKRNHAGSEPIVKMPFSGWLPAINA